MTARTKSADAMVGRVVLGRYRILRHLADGGMGAIYLARSEGAGGFVRPIVVKCVLPNHIGDDKMAALFAREARIMSNLRHPGIVSVIDFAQHDDMHIMVMDYVHGFHLGRWHEYIKRDGGDFPAEIALHIIVAVLRALHYAHTLKGADGTKLDIVHRDVTPSNVLLDVEGHVKLADFGIAQMSTDRTEVGNRAIKGKFPYLAPEILENADPSPATDVYSAGVTLHELLVGRNEFTASGIPAIVARVLEHEPTPVDRVRPDVSAALAPVVAKALAKKPGERYQSAAAFAEALSSVRRFTEDEAARQLAQLATADFRDARMAKMLAVPQLNELESDWTTPAAGIRNLIDPDNGVAEKLAAGLEDTAAGARADDAKSGYARHTPRRLTAAETIDRTVAESPTARIKETGSTARVGEKKFRTLWPAIGGGLALAAIGTVAVAALMRSSSDTAVGKEPAYVVVTGRQDPPEGVAADAAPTAVPATTPDAAPAPVKQDPPPDKKRPRKRPKKPPETSAARLTRAFGKRKGKISACFKKHTQDLRGAPQTSIRFKVDMAGNVSSAEVLPAAIQSTGLGRCLQTVAKRTRFGKQSKAVTFRVPIRARRK